MPRKRKRSWLTDRGFYHGMKPEDLEWLDKFNMEYYRGHFGSDPLHPKKYKSECDKRAYSMRVDAMTLAFVSLSHEE